MSYNKCRTKYLDEIMKEYKQGKLKLQNGKKVKDSKQAIAIALNIAQRKCKYSKKDMIEVEKKVMMFLKEDDRKISKTRVPLTNVIETRVFIKNILKKGEKSKAKIVYKLLLQRIINAGKKGIKIDQNIFEELEILQKLKL
jgi:hypothetical protein